MKYVLFVMFFTTPPALQGQEVWALQTTAATEFESKRACSDAANILVASINNSDTIKLYGWCFSTEHDDTKSLGPATSSVPEFQSRRESRPNQ